MNPLAELMRSTAGSLGIDPRDLATAISYETGGTFDPNITGPTTKWGQHRGLLQWGEPQAERYGVANDWSPANQMRATGNYLRDAGVQPGMGLLDIYSAINAGKVGRYNASDETAGGAPGTVRDKVLDQMSGHTANAERLLGGEGATAQSDQTSPNPAPDLAMMRPRPTLQGRTLPRLPAQTPPTISPKTAQAAPIAQFEPTGLARLFAKVRQFDEMRTA